MNLTNKIITVLKFTDKLIKKVLQDNNPNILLTQIDTVMNDH